MHRSTAVVQEENRNFFLITTVVDFMFAGLAHSPFVLTEHMTRNDIFSDTVHPFFSEQVAYICMYVYMYVVKFCVVDCIQCVVGGHE